MKQLLSIIGGLFKKNKTYSSLFSEAVAEGIRETLKEMGYHFSKNDKKS
jgi:hypothetical protein